LSFGFVFLTASLDGRFFHTYGMLVPMWVEVLADIAFTHNPSLIRIDLQWILLDGAGHKKTRKPCR
jgi:hypothetical protein